MYKAKLSLKKKPTLVEAVFLIFFSDGDCSEDGLSDDEDDNTLAPCDRLNDSKTNNPDQIKSLLMSTNIEIFNI